MSAPHSRSAPRSGTAAPVGAAPRLHDPSGGRVDARSLGRTVVGVAVGLTALGLVMIYSWTAVRLSMRRGDPNETFLRQLGWFAVAGVAGFVASRLPLDLLRRRAPLLLTLTLLALAATLVPGFGLVRNHSRRWLALGPVSFQASEFLKVAVVLFLADGLARRDDEGRTTRVRWLALLAPVGFGAALVLAEPDLGTALFVCATAVVMLGLAGVRIGQVVVLGATALPLVVAFAASKFQHVAQRLAFFQGKASFQLEQAVAAVGSGGLIGAGLGAGTQKFGRVAEMQTDFIFALIGEETGFVGCAAVILAFVAFVVYGKRIADRAHASAGLFPFYLAAGATFVVTFQALINVAVVTGCAPTKGVSLPFISVGGSGLVAAYVCVGLLVNVSRLVAEREGGEPWR